MSRIAELKFLWLSFALFMLGSCATQQYLYLPAAVSGQQTDRRQKEKASYQVPAVSPKGSVQTMSPGVVKLKPNSGGEKISALQLRLVVSNQSDDAPWTIEPQAQTVSFPNVGKPTTPIFVQPDMSNAANVSINRGEIRTFDLYYPLPNQANSAGKIPEFDFRWQVKTGTQLVENTTSFDRVPIYYDPGPGYPGYYWPYGPYSPYYPYGLTLGFGYGYGYSWHHSPILVVPPSKPVIIGR